MIAGTTAAALLPAAVTAATKPLKVNPTNINNELAIIGGDDDLEITLNLDDSPTIFIKNNTDKVVIVRHVYPGIVRANGKTFDINSLFKSSAAGIDGRRTRRFSIAPIHSLASERPFPRRLTSSKPVRVSAVSGGKQPKMHLNTPRNFFFA
jgi:hypothetical protein